MEKNPVLAKLILQRELYLGASRGELQEDVPALLEILRPAIAEIEGEAASRIAALKDELAMEREKIEQERREWERERNDLHRARLRVEVDAAQQAATSSVSPLDEPDGFYVYFLWAADGKLMYVGKSTNIFVRLGAHLGDPMRRRRVRRVTVKRYPTEAAMERAESRAIGTLHPEWNVVGRAA